MTFTELGFLLLAEREAVPYLIERFGTEGLVDFTAAAIKELGGEVYDQLAIHADTFTAVYLTPDTQRIYSNSLPSPEIEQP